jgi:hypothetical protein
MEGPTAKEMTPWLQTITSLVSRSECVQFSVDPQEQPKIWHWVSITFQVVTSGFTLYQGCIICSTAQNFFLVQPAGSSLHSCPAEESLQLIPIGVVLWALRGRPTIPPLSPYSSNAHKRHLIIYFNLLSCSTSPASY